MYTKETHGLKVYLATYERDSGKSHLASAPCHSESISLVNVSFLALHPSHFSYSTIAFYGLISPRYPIRPTSCQEFIFSILLVSIFLSFYFG